MKKLASILALVAISAAAQTTPQPVDVVPSWFTNPPENQNAIYAVGDGVSANYSGAIGNARANAFETICQSAGGKVRSQTKVYRHDTETASTSITTTVIRNFCPDVDITGAQIIRQAVVSEGSRKRAFVLVALPTEPTKSQAAAKETRRQETENKDAMSRELKELDKLVEPEPVKAEAEPKADSHVAPVVVDEKRSEIKLMDVDNKEYRARRDAALQKEGAVIGQITVR